MVTQYILIGFIVLLIIAYPILMYSRNKKENQRMQEQTNSLKRGDRVLTTSGVYGKIVDLRQEDDRTIVDIETGNSKQKGYISVDAYAIYKIFVDEKETGTAEVKTDNEKKVEESVAGEENVEATVSAEDRQPKEKKSKKSAKTEQPSEDKKENEDSNSDQPKSN